MTFQTQHESTNSANQRRISTGVRKGAAVLAGCVALIGVATTAVAQVGSGGGTTSTTSLSTNDAKLSKSGDSCKFQATLLHGLEVAIATSNASTRAQQTLEHSGSKLWVSTQADRVTVGTNLGVDTYLLVEADSRRRNELIDLVKKAIDAKPFVEKNDVDLAFTFGRNQCNLSSALNDELTLKDFLNSDSSLSFSDGDTRCDVTSLFESANPNGEVDFKDFDLDDFDFELSSEGQGFSIGLDTGQGTIGLKCNDKR